MAEKLDKIAEELSRKEITSKEALRELNKLAEELEQEQKDKTNNENFKKALEKLANLPSLKGDDLPEADNCKCCSLGRRTAKTRTSSGDRRYR